MAQRFKFKKNETLFINFKKKNKKAKRKTNLEPFLAANRALNLLASQPSGWTRGPGRGRDSASRLVLTHILAALGFGVPKAVQIRCFLLFIMFSSSLLFFRWFLSVFLFWCSFGFPNSKLRQRDDFPTAREVKRNGVPLLVQMKAV